MIKLKDILSEDFVNFTNELHGVEEDLRRWAKEKWTDQNGNPCGSSKSKGVVKCRPSKKVSKKSPKTWSQVDKKKEVAKKRRVGMGKRTKKAEVVTPIE